MEIFKIINFMKLNIQTCIYKSNGKCLGSSNPAVYFGQIKSPLFTSFGSWLLNGVFLQDVKGTYCSLFGPVVAQIFLNKIKCSLNPKILVNPCLGV